MKPFDPRLLRYARQTRVHLALLVVLGMVTAGLVIAEAQLLAGAITAVFLHGAGLAALRGTLIALAAVLAVRALVAWVTQVASYRASAEVKSQLRRAVLARAVALGPRWLAAGGGAQQEPARTARTGRPGNGPHEEPAGHARTGTAEVAAIATSGIDALDAYFAKYLPQLVLAVIVPLAVLARIASSDLLAGITIALTLPLVPVFSALLGRAAGKHAERRWRALAVLSHHFLDVVAGLPTLKVFGRAGAQAESIRKVTGDYRRETMGTLRLAFLSSLVLELIATMSVALVAVGIGLSLVYGRLGLETGLLALILAPEAYLPLRQAGAQFHASANGLAAAGEAFAVLEAPVTGGPRGSLQPVPLPRAVRVDGLRVDHAGRSRPAPDGISLTLARGEITVVAGPSGCGKSTLIAVLLGFAQPSAGRVLVEDPGGVTTDLTQFDPDAWRAITGWVPQDPVLFTGTVASNISLGLPGASPQAVAAAAAAAALTEIPLAKAVGERGGGLSSGQRRRVALARALLPGRPLLLLDEPTAGLDAATEAAVLATLRAEAARGRAVLVASHRPAVLAAADTVVVMPQSAGQAPAVTEMVPS